MKALKWLFRQMGGVNGLLLTLYACAIFAVEFYLEPARKLRYIILFIGLLILCPLTIRLLKRARPLRAGPPNRLDTGAKRAGWFLGFFAFSLALLLVWYFAYYPMSVINDTYDQYAQVLSGQYVDWHPVLHTLLVLTIPLKLTGTFAGVILPQMLAYALALAYMALTLLEYGNLPCALLALLYVLLNPNTGSIATYATKDVTFAICALGAATCGLRVWFTHGAWLEKWWRRLGFAALLVCATIVRHNAVLFTLPFLLAVLLLAGKKQRIRVAVDAAVIFLLIKGVLYGALGVEKPDRRLVETLGLPLTVISSVAKVNPDCLDQRSQAFLDTVATKEDWQEFRVGSFNSNKWAVDLYAIDASGAGTILHTAWNCFTADPKDAFTSLFLLTKFVYSLDGSSISRIRPHVTDPIAGDYAWYRVDRTSPALRTALETLRERMESTPLKYATLLGVVNLLVIAFLLGRTDFHKREDWLRLLLCLPLLLYNFGTMLLLSGEDFRFFYASFPLCPVLLFLLMSQREPGKTGDGEFNHTMIKAKETK